MQVMTSPPIQISSIMSRNIATAKKPQKLQFEPFYRLSLRIPVQRGHRFRWKADSNPVIADSR